MLFQHSIPFTSFKFSIRLRSFKLYPYFNWLLFSEEFISSMDSTSFKRLISSLRLISLGWFKFTISSIFKSFMLVTSAFASLLFHLPLSFVFVFPVDTFSFYRAIQPHTHRLSLTPLVPSSTEKPTQSSFYPHL